jgi:hypothetical protein
MFSLLREVCISRLKNRLLCGFLALIREGFFSSIGRGLVAKISPFSG